MISEIPFTSLELQRYARHLTLPEVGLDGQHRLKQAKVLCIGAGGLGASALLYLAAAGVGTLGIVEDDRVELSNLQRQILFSTDAIGEPKAHAASSRLRALNPEIQVIPITQRLTRQNAVEMIRPYDVVLDCTDNFYTRYVINDACVFLQKPNIYASIAHFEGQCSVFSASGGPCYRCLYPVPPPQAAVPSCAEAGVIGALPGLLGSLQAMEALKLILKQGEALIGRLLRLDALTMQFNTLRISKNTSKACCTPPFTFNAVDDDCTPRCAQATIQEISVQDLQALQAKQVPFTLLDVRQPFEYAICHLGGMLIPLDKLVEQLDRLDAHQPIVIHCKHDNRSHQAAALLAQHGFQQISVLRGGILAWIEAIDPMMQRY